VDDRARLSMAYSFQARQWALYDLSLRSLPARGGQYTGDRRRIQTRLQCPGTSASCSPAGFDAAACSAPWNG